MSKIVVHFELLKSTKTVHEKNKNMSTFLMAFFCFCNFLGCFESHQWKLLGQSKNVSNYEYRLETIHYRNLVKINQTPLVLHKKMSTKLKKKTYITVKPMRFSDHWLFINDRGVYRDAKNVRT